MTPTLALAEHARQAYVEPPVRTRKIAIVGHADETRDAAPWTDESVEIWGLNMGPQWMPRLTRLWELHNRAQLEKENTEQGSLGQLSWLQTNATIPIYMVEPHADIPCAVRFPVEAVKAFLADRCGKLVETPYFTSTFAFMQAYAVMKIVAQRERAAVPEPGEFIGVYGVEMLNGEEYAFQRSCAEFWCGVILGLGIALDIPARSALLESDGLYGYERAESLELLSRMLAYYEHLRATQLKKRDEAKVRAGQAQSDYQTYDGSVQGIEKVLLHMKYLLRGGKV